MEKKDVVTIFQDVIVNEFVIRVKDEATLTPVPKEALQEYFYMMLSSKSEKLNKFWLQVVEGRIYMRNTQESALLAYIDIGYARLKLLRGVDVAGRTLNGIRFIKNKNYEEIFHESMTVVQQWFDSLKRYCILSKFREVYQIKNVIGKGNFAKVYITTRVSDHKDFAVKIFDKKLILQDKFERVS